MRSATAITVALLLGLAVGLAPAGARAMDPNAAAEAAEPAAAKPVAKPAPGTQERRVAPHQPQRTFHGTVESADAGGVTVKLRSGKQRRFPKTHDAAVRGQRRSWDALAAGDPVTLRVRGKQVYAVVVEPHGAAAAGVEAQREAMLKKHEEREEAAKNAPPRKKREPRPRAAKPGAEAEAE